MMGKMLIAMSPEEAKIVKDALISYEESLLAASTNYQINPKIREAFKGMSDTATEVKHRLKRELGEE